MADQAQRSRSVYVGNLPWDVKDEELKKIFSQVGTIVSLRMPSDPESGRSRGFAFCEFKDQDSVAVAIKHFNGYDLNGRKIRVDSAANNMEKDGKVGGGGGGNNLEVQFGEPCDPIKAPEIIAGVVGRMSPQQVQSMIQDTKKCLQADPEEARIALINNPQLTYALLLALVRGRFISKERGTEAMVKPDQPLLPLFPESRPNHQFIQPQQMGDPRLAGPGPMPPPPLLNQHGPAGSGMQVGRQQPGLLPIPVAAPLFPIGGGPVGRQPDYGRQPDLRRPDPYDPRPRTSYQPSPVTQSTRSPRPDASPRADSAASADEKEKAQLIMQVLQLREEDIARMEPSQQRTVRVLREQFKNIST